MHAASDTFTWAYLVRWTTFQGIRDKVQDRERHPLASAFTFVYNNSTPRKAERKKHRWSLKRGLIPLLDYVRGLYAPTMGPDFQSA